MSCKCNGRNGRNEFAAGTKLELIEKELFSEDILEYITLENAKLRQLIHNQDKKISSKAMILGQLEKINNKHRETIHKKEEEIDNLDRVVKAQEGIIELAIEALEELQVRYIEIQSLHEKYMQFYV